MSPYILKVRNVNEALSASLRLLAGSGVVKETSRNGDVRVWPGPVITHTLFPRERVLFSPLRNANPFFHLFESLWMLDGRNDLPFIAQFNQQMAIYSDDGGLTQPAAYGHRWRNFFGYDQIVTIVEELKRNPGTRRAVLAMWDGREDLNAAVRGSADVPCNTQCFFTIRDGKLDMSVTCRSNDVLWGAHGANAVHFSILQEYIAAHVGVQLGEMVQFSWNYHLYDGILNNDPLEVAQSCLDWDLYQRAGGVGPGGTPMFEHLDKFEAGLHGFCQFAAYPDRHADDAPVFDDPFLATVAMPMLLAWDAFKRKDWDAVDCYVELMPPCDWKVNSKHWLRQRKGAWEAKQKEQADG